MVSRSRMRLSHAIVVIVFCILIHSVPTNYSQAYIVFIDSK